MTISDSEAIAPFAVNFVEKRGMNYHFIVNRGDVNSYILNTYKHRSTTSGANAINELYFTDMLSGQKQKIDESRFAPMGISGAIFKMGESFTPTFVAKSGCSVYLTIPKIPEGYDHINSLNAGKEIWWLDSKIDFLNQFSIVTSNDVNFSALTSGDFKYIEKENRFRDPNFDYFERFESYRFRETVDPSGYGKIYFKLADIDVNPNLVTVKPFVRSNIVSPTKFIRLGALNLRYIKICYTTIHANSFNLLSDKPEYGPFPNIFGNLPSEVFYYPPFFNLTLDEIRSQVLDKLTTFIDDMNELYYPILYQFPIEGDEEIELRPKAGEVQDGKLENLQVFSIVLVYKENLGGKVTIENLWEDIEGYDALYDIVANKDLDEDFVSPPLRKIREKEVLEELGITKDMDLVSLVGFEEDLPEG